ncbi:MAG: hypothetical protein FWD53_08600 [Phycisphaerales bacterium]|nr:hypothetical protein [Phycisphaerales bacterium]
MSAAVGWAEKEQGRTACDTDVTCELAVLHVPTVGMRTDSDDLACQASGRLVAGTNEDVCTA